MTTPATNASEAPRDFVGIQSICEKLALNKRSEESPRLHIHLSLPIAGNEALLTELSKNIKNVLFVGFGFMQGALNFPNDPAAPVDPLAAATGGLVSIVASNGDTFLPHKFQASKPDKKVCAICDAPEAHVIHAEESRAARAAMRPDASAGDTPATAASNGDVTVSDLAQSLIDEARRPPESDEEAQQQAEATERLSARSR